MSRLFPIKDVAASRSDTELQAEHAPDLPHAKERLTQRLARTSDDAPRCGCCQRSADDLLWVYFRSPEWTWENACGRAGWLLICPVSDDHVEFMLESMN
jgi:hypothetical protein